MNLSTAKKHIFYGLNRKQQQNNTPFSLLYTHFNLKDLTATVVCEYMAIQIYITIFLLTYELIYRHFTRLSLKARVLFRWALKFLSLKPHFLCA